MKLPAIQLYAGDWFKDAALSQCGAATRGIWIDFLLRMHDRDRSGEISGTRRGLAQLGRCSEAELDAALAELGATETATVTERNGIITVTNRRMRSEYLERQAAAKRAKNYRNRHGEGGETKDTPAPTEARHGESNSEVTPYSSSSSSISSSEERETRARETRTEPGQNPAGFRETTQADIDRASQVIALYPVKAAKDQRPIRFTLEAQNLLAARIARHPEYPWEEHARLEGQNRTPPDGINWVRDLPNPIALERLRKAAPSEPKREYFTADSRGRV